MEYHVKITGNDCALGTENTPWRTISKAASVARPGDVVTVHEGIYREWVSPAYGGSQFQRITYQAAKGEKVVISGAEHITDWKDEGGGVFKALISNTLFGDFNPYKDVISGDWFMTRNPVFHSGEVYLNGKSLYETDSLDKVKKPEETADSLDKPGSLYTWYCETDDSNTSIWANFHGADPRREKVEINVRPYVFWPRETGKGYITVRGFILKQAATNWAPPTGLQMGLIGPHWSKGWIIEDNIISDSKCCGISLGKNKRTGHNEWTRLGFKMGHQREYEWPDSTGKCNTAIFGKNLGRSFVS